MNREIKFRAKYIIGGYPFAYGNAVIQLDGRAYIFEENTLEAEVRDTGDPEDHYWLVGGLYEVNPSTIGQYTGLKDKDGKEIYEGDIIADTYGNKHIIICCEERARFVAVNISAALPDDVCSITKQWIDECEKEVIGNIHENPEMIEQ